MRRELKGIYVIRKIFLLWHINIIGEIFPSANIPSKFLLELNDVSLFTFEREIGYTF